MNTNQKISRACRASGGGQKSRPKKRKQYFNPKTTEKAKFSTSRKKLNNNSNKMHVPLDETIEFRIMNFTTVFTELSNFVKCKTCDGEVKFQPTKTRGLAFEICVICDNCTHKNIPSDSSLAINKRFTFTMRTLGLGLAGCSKFCGLMDMPPFVSQTSYQVIEQVICTAVTDVFNVAIKLAVNEEIHANPGNQKNHLTVSGDGTWKKRGFTSLYGVSSLIGWHTGKILDVVVKSAYCKMCEVSKKEKGSVEFLEWKEMHQNDCDANHTGSAGKMEVDAMIEMFKRSKSLFNVSYAYYIGDGDSKTYAGIIEAKPYDDVEVKKKECVGHVQKRMGTRLRDCKKKNKGLGGKGKLTGKMIDKLTVYYGLAIRRNTDSAEAMKKAIWATYYHYSSTDSNPQHQNCPSGSSSWCEWQKAYAALPEGKKNKNKIVTFKHTYQSLPSDVLKAIKPIYEDLSKDELLERCVGGFTQNNNESYNQNIWKISPKNLPGGATSVKIAAYTSACIFNEGSKAILNIVEKLGGACGAQIHAYIEKQDATRINIAEKRSHQATREVRMSRRQKRLDCLEAAVDAETLFYGPGIDDSI